MTRPDISVVVRVHDEGPLLQHTFKSIGAASKEALRAGITSEILIIADCADKDTNAYLKRFLNKVLTIKHQIHTVKFNSIPKSLNKGIELAKGTYITIIEAGDLMCLNWLIEASKALKQHTNFKILYPHYVFSFGAKDQIWETKPLTNSDITPEGLVTQNYFPTLVMATKKVFKQYKYDTSTQQDKPYNFVSWLWGCQTMSGGAKYAVVKETVLAKRYIQGQGSKSGQFLPQIELFSPPHFAKIFKRPPLSYVIKKEQEDQRPRIKQVILKTLTSMTHYIHGSLLVRTLKKIHPRADVFLSGLRNETLHLFRPLQPEARSPIPEWLKIEIARMHDIEHRIFLSQHLENVIEHYVPQLNILSIAYWDLVTKIGLDCDILIMVPYLKNGGAEREIANLVHTALKLNPDLVIKIVATDSSESTWAHNINRKVQFITPGQEFFSLDIDSQAILFVTLCIQLGIKKLHIINSLPGYVAIEKHGAILKKNTDIYITVFSIDRTPEGRKTHMFTEKLQTAFNFVDKVFTDNQTVVNELVNLMGIDKNKFSIHYQPCGATSLQSGDMDHAFKTQPNKILWAGRIDRQKRPDILIKIAEHINTHKLPIEFHAYGSPAFEDYSYFEQIKGSSLIKYGGPFDGGIGSLPVKDFDIFLLTSEWEGMPNVLLEAIMNGLLIIAPNVGGVAELVRDQNTGFLVKYYNDISGYENAIKKAIRYPKRSVQIIRNAQELVSSRHSYKNYEQLIRKEQKYLGLHKK